MSSTGPAASPQETPDLVLFKTAKSPLEAELIANVLRDAGIPAHVEGSLLADEFAVSQRLMGLNSVRIQVPRNRLADAEATLAEANAASAEVDAAAEAMAVDEPPAASAEAPRSPPRWSLVVALAIAAAVFFVLWMETRAELRQATQSGLADIEWDDAAREVVYRWRDSGALMARLGDRDGNGVPETTSCYNRAGELLNTAHDDDQNGMHEKLHWFARGGAIVLTALDADQNGVPERVEQEQKGARVVYFDADQDLRTERIEERDRSGSLARAWTWSEGRGFVPVQ